MAYMTREQRIGGLKELALKHPEGDVDHIYGYGRWKNPLNPRSTGLRWTRRDLELFKLFQQELNI
jgi:hypothetical protein